MFAKRLLSSIVLWTVLLTILFYLGSLASALLCCLVALLALWEFYDMLDKAGMPCSKSWGLAGGVVLSAGAWWFSAHPHRLSATFEMLLLLGLVLGLFIYQLFRRQNGAPTLPRVANTLLGVLYVPWLFTFIPKIQYFYPPSHGGVAGPGWLFVFYLVVVTKFCDIGAYSTGRVFGRHKLAPNISPGKTWEGFLGGLVVSVIASITAFKYLEPRISVVGFGYWDALLLGVLLGLMGAAGDLVESLLKRETHVKDSGGMLPGIGGALDLVDSLLFTAPVLYAWLLLSAQFRG